MLFQRKLCQTKKSADDVLQKRFSNAKIKIRNYLINITYSCLNKQDLNNR